MVLRLGEGLSAEAGKVGKQTADWTWLTSMSARRAGTSYDPGRICSYVMTSSLISSLLYPTAVSRRVNGRCRSSYTHQSPMGPSSPGRPMTGLNRPPRKVISFSGARTMRGPVSWYFLGSRSCHTVGGSTVWSSTEMISGNVVSVSMSVTVAPI